MDGTGNYSSSSSGLDRNVDVGAERKNKKKIKPDSYKKRKVIQKASVMKVESSTYNVKQMKSEGPPPLDSWTWRKYGQKPIKGSPFPRGYYRCSTSKGCSAKKQVERCKTDSSIIIITYTSDHNHPSPHQSSSSSLITNPNHYEELPITPRKEYQDAEQQFSEEQTFIISSTTVDHEHEQEEEGHVFHYLYSQSPLFNHSSLVIRDDEDPFGENLLDKVVVFDGEIIDDYHLSLDDDDHHHQLSLPTVTSHQENDGFFDELEEL